MENWISTNILSLLNLLILIALSLFGRNWVNKKNEEIKSLYSKEQYIHRVQFEKEFNLYSELWKHVHQYRSIINNIMSFLKEEKDKSSIKSAELNLKKLKRIGSEIAKIVDHYKPFFAEEVYEKTLNFAKESEVLISLYLLPEKEFHDKEALELDKFDSIIDEIEQVIRKRIRNIGEAKLVG